MKFKINIDGKNFFTDDPGQIMNIVKKNHEGRVTFDPTIFPNQSHWMIYKEVGERVIGYVFRVR